MPQLLNQEQFDLRSFSRTAHRMQPTQAMKFKPPSNGLSARANRCLATAGIPAEKEAVLQALKTDVLFPFFCPTL